MTLNQKILRDLKLELEKDPEETLVTWIEDDLLFLDLEPNMSNLRIDYIDYGLTGKVRIELKTWLKEPDSPELRYLSELGIIDETETLNGIWSKFLFKVNGSYEDHNFSFDIEHETNLKQVSMKQLSRFRIESIDDTKDLADAIMRYTWSRILEYVFDTSVLRTKITASLRA
jgi:hypothetical protein